MAYREKIAWLSLVAMVVAYTLYFSIAGPMMHGGGQSSVSFVVLLAAILTTQAIVAVVGSLIIAIRSGREARAPADERDRAIARRGAAVAYFVLMVGMIIVGCVMPAREEGWHLINAALFMLAVAETVRYGLIVTSYRRGWHG